MPKPNRYLSSFYYHYKDLFLQNYKSYYKNFKIRRLHKKSFKKYKNKFSENDVVIVGSGPSLENYKPIYNAIHIGVNKTFLNKDLELDFLFFQDFSSCKDFLSEIKKYKPHNCRKFAGIIPLKHVYISDNELLGFKASRYYTSFPDKKFSTDILNNKLGDFSSVIFPAINFALFTNPKRIYLVGCDCNSNGYFDGSKMIHEQNLLNHLIRSNFEGWLFLKDFVKQHYPHIEIISINPVGLKGIFTDIYTQNQSNEVQP